MNNIMKMKQVNHREKHAKLRELAQSIHKVAMAMATADVPSGLREKVLRQMCSAFRKREATPDTGCDCQIEAQHDPIPVEEAISVLGDGHSVWSPAFAMSICQAVGVKYPEHLQEHFYSDWMSFKGYHTSPEHEGEIGVDSLDLSNYVVKTFGLTVKQYLGGGFQAQANAKAVRKHLNLPVPEGC